MEREAPGLNEGGGRESRNVLYLACQKRLCKKVHNQVAATRLNRVWFSGGLGWGKGGQIAPLLAVVGRGASLKQKEHFGMYI